MIEHLVYLTESLMLFHSALVNDINESLFHEFFEYAAAGLLTLKEHLTSVVSAYYYDSEIRRIIMYVHIEQEFLWDTRDANRRPSLSILHRGVRINVV